MKTIAVPVVNVFHEFLITVRDGPDMRGRDPGMIPPHQAKGLKIRRSLLYKYRRPSAHGHDMLYALCPNLSHEGRLTLLAD